MSEWCATCDRPTQGQRTICKVCEAGMQPGSDNNGPPGASRVDMEGASVEV